MYEGTGMIVDATSPTVNGLENNKTYCGDVKFTVTKAIITSQTVSQIQIL